MEEVGGRGEAQGGGGEAGRQTGTDRNDRDRKRDVDGTKI